MTAFRIFDSVADLIAGAERAIVQLVEKGTRSIALSGGLTPKPLYQSLGRNASIRQANITWVIVDERFVPIDDPQSNAGMIQQTLFASGMPPSHRFLRFHTELDDPAATARKFEREWQELAIDRLDLVLLGMGDDGHTASLFPGTPVLAVENRIASEVFVPRMNSWRVTLTKPVLRAAKMRFVLAEGAAKRPVIERVRSGSDDPIAQVTHLTETWWFVDREAVDSSEGSS